MGRLGLTCGRGYAALGVLGSATVCRWLSDFSPVLWNNPVHNTWGHEDEFSAECWHQQPLVCGLCYGVRQDLKSGSAACFLTTWKSSVFHTSRHQETKNKTMSLPEKFVKMFKQGCKRKPEWSDNVGSKHLTCDTNFYFFHSYYFRVAHFWNSCLLPVLIFNPALVILTQNNLTPYCISIFLSLFYFGDRAGIHIYLIKRKVILYLFHFTKMFWPELPDLTSILFDVTWLEDSPRDRHQIVRDGGINGHWKSTLLVRALVEPASQVLYCW